jgi:hypothetical protein
MDACDEQFEVIRIRLWNAQRTTAVLSECHSADSVLACWAGRGECGLVGFEVTFLDGLVVRGRHEFFRAGKRRCLFATCMRRLLEHAPGRLRRRPGQARQA